MFVAMLLTGAISVSAAVSSDQGGASEALPAGSTSAQTAACTDEIGPGMAPPADVQLNIPGFHAAWYGQSGYPTLCPGSTATATVAFINTGTLGWSTQLGATAFLGTSGPQDSASLLGGTDTGWSSWNRPAAQPSDWVGPGQVAWFQFAVKAPLAPGAYRLALRPLIEGHSWLEDYGVFWHVTVKDTSAPTVSRAEPTARTYFPALDPGGARSIRASSLMYHYVGDLPADADKFRIDLTVSPTDFEQHLVYLKNNGFNTISQKELWWSLHTGTPLPPNPVVLTFDDGYVDHYTNVLPLMQKHGMVGTFAVTAKLVGTPGYITRDMVRALADAGMDVVSHSVDHWSLNVMTLPQQTHQLCTSRRLLEEWTGREVRHYIYPAGDFFPTPVAAFEHCGYLSAMRKDGGSIQSSNYMFELRRYRVRGQQGLGALLTALAQ